MLPEQVTVAARDLVAAPGEQMVDVQRVEIRVRDLRELLCGALNAPGARLQGEQYDGAE
jgi:hypothetical protein